MSVLCMTGWQQKADALNNVAPSDSTYFDYASYADVGDMLAALPKTPALAIGWSLGGQLLVRAVAEGHIQPKKLLLIGAPFQCVASADFPYGMSAEMMQEFKDGYTLSPYKTLAQFNPYIGFGDSHDVDIIKQLTENVEL